MDKKVQTIETYDRSAVGMAKKFSDMRTRADDVARFFELIENKENPSVIEIGCGNGREGAEILKYTPNYIGMDVSEGMLEQAKVNVPVEKLVLADIETYQFPEGLDGIISFASLLHSNKERIAEIFINADKNLVKGGVFYISLKKGFYNSEGDTRTDEFGERTYFFYDSEIIKTAAGNAFEVVYYDEQHLKGQDWFTIVFRKVN